MHRDMKRVGDIIIIITMKDIMKLFVDQNSGDTIFMVDLCIENAAGKKSVGGKGS